MKNYYKILEIDKDASPEIIKVAYKLLVKKYHPDLKEGKEKKLAEEKIKEINEAYDVLSDFFKKTEYDKTLENSSFTIEKYQELVNENITLKKELDYFKSIYNRTNRNTNANSAYRSNMYDKSGTVSNAKNTATSNNKYYNLLKNAFNNFDETIKTIIAIGITFLIIFIIFSIPFLRDFLSNILSNGYIFIIILLFLFYIYYFRNKK